MLPRWHIVFGVLFTFLIWFFAQGISWLYLSLIFLSSFLIDLDHYVTGLMKTGKFGLRRIFGYYKEIEALQKKEKVMGIRRRGDFYLFHTVEFHALIAIISIFWTAFFYIFIGMVFHSLLDLFYLLKTDYLYRREYFFFSWLGKRFS